MQKCKQLHIGKSKGKITAEEHREHINEHTFDSQPSHFTDIKTDKTDKKLKLKEQVRLNMYYLMKMVKFQQKRSVTILWAI